MIGFYNKENRILSNKTIIQCFLKNLHSRQIGHLATIPKILFTRNDWSHKVVLHTVLSTSTDRTVCMSQLEHDIIIPVVDEMLLKMEHKITDCDAVLFHSLPLPRNTKGCIQSLDGILARIINVDDIATCPATIARIDIAFTPMWLKKGKPTMLPIETCKRIIKEYETEKLNNNIKTILIDFKYGTLGRSEVIVELHRAFSVYLKKINQ